MRMGVTLAGHVAARSERVIPASAGRSGADRMTRAEALAWAVWAAMILVGVTVWALALWAVLAR